jgi:hypothetical protein
MSIISHIVLDSGVQKLPDRCKLVFIFSFLNNHLNILYIICTELDLPLVPVTAANSIYLVNHCFFIISHKKFNSEETLFQKF